MNGSPLSKADVSQLTSALYRAQLNRKDIDLLESAGVNVDEFRAMNEHAINRINAILGVYGPAKG